MLHAETAPRGQSFDRAVLLALEAAPPCPYIDKTRRLHSAPFLLPYIRRETADPSEETFHRPEKIAPLPVFADESVQRLVDVQRLKGVVSGINIKLMKCTGMREAWKMVNLAHALGLKVMLGCMTETSCAVSAAAQLSPMVDHADLDGNLLISNDPFRGVQIKGGKIVLTSAPGIGIVEA